jgi:hypothetical protein
VDRLRSNSNDLDNIADVIMSNWEWCFLNLNFLIR